MICKDSWLFTSSFYQKMLRMFVLKLQKRFEKGVGIKLCVTDKTAPLTKDNIWHWTPRRRLVGVWIYYSMLTRGECGSEGLFFFQISNKKQTMPPSSDVCCFIMHDVCKEECDHVGNPSGVQTRVLLFSPPAPHTKAHILNMLHIGSSR